jgi:uncharacterized protein (UPF0332 family)
LEQAKETLEAAKKLQEAGLFRDSVNRGYYAMFYAGMALLASKALGTSKHSGLISMFGQHFVKTGMFSADAGRHLRQAFELRQECDYESFVEPTNDQAKEIISNAADFVAETGRV